MKFKCSRLAQLVRFYSLWRRKKSKDMNGMLCYESKADTRFTHWTTSPVNKDAMITLGRYLESNNVEVK